MLRSSAPLIQAPNTFPMGPGSAEQRKEHCTASGDTQTHLHPLTLAGACLDGRPGTHGTWVDWWCRAPWRSGPGLAIGLEQTRLANAFPGLCSLPMTGQRAGGGGTAARPHPDEMPG